MRARCLRPSYHKYPSYGGRGITICPEWLDDFAAFLRDVGPRPSPDHSIERLDNNGPYSPDNCVWANRYVQAANKRSNVNRSMRGETHHLREWARRLGCGYGQLYYRVVTQGRSLEDAMSILKMCRS